MLRTEWCMEMRTDINHKTKWRFHCATPFRVFGMVPQAVPEIKIGQRSVLIICFCSPPFTYEGIYPLFKLEDALICRICTPRSVFRLSWIRTLMSSFEAQCQIWQVHNTIKHLYVFPASGSHMFFFRETPIKPIYVFVSTSEGISWHLCWWFGPSLWAAGIPPVPPATWTQCFRGCGSK